MTFATRLGNNLVVTGWLICILMASARISSAYAYSGAGAECGNPALEMAAISATPDEFEVVIDEVIDRYVRFYKTKAESSRSFWGAKETSHEQKVATRKELRAGFVNYWSGCDGPLIDYVAAAGNIDNAKYLVGIGADPSGKRPRRIDFERMLGSEEKVIGEPVVTTVFMRCLSLNPDRKGISVFRDRNRLPIDLDKMLLVYRFLISAGGDVNAKAFNGLTALHRCNDPAIVKLLLENGADPNVGVVEASPYSSNTTIFNLRVFQAFGRFSDVGGPIINTEDAQEISRMIAAKVSKRSVNRVVADSICHRCSRGALLAECKAYSQLIEGVDKRIFAVANFKNDDSDSYLYLFRCSEILDPEFSKQHSNRFYLLDLE